MGDNGKSETQEVKPVVLTITFNPDGKVTVTGPIQDRILSYGLLELAREVIYEYAQKNKVNLIFPNSNTISDLMKR